MDGFTSIVTISEYSEPTDYSRAIGLKTCGGSHKAILRSTLEICALRPSFFAKIYSNLSLWICALPITFCIFSQIWVRSTTPYTIHPSFMNATLGL
jgi:hypothetical protein